jgi:dihydroorotase
MTKLTLVKGFLVAAALAFVPASLAQTPTYQLVLKGGHVIDPRNNLSAVRDVAINVTGTGAAATGVIAAVAPNIPASQAGKVVDVTGLYVTPGLIDIHVHVYPGEKLRTYAGGDQSLMPDGFTLRSCVTTVADAGSTGWRTFDDFKRRVIERSTTRVTSFLNINGSGMGPTESNVADMEVAPTLEMALKHKGVIIGIKSAHFSGGTAERPDWSPYEKAVEVGKQANIPVMVDFGSNRTQGRTIAELFTRIFRPGDMFTHMYGGVRGEQDPVTRGPSQAFIDGRKKGIKLDVGHGGGSFKWSAAIPMMKAGFKPDSISTDLHISSMNSGMKSQLEVMSKFLAMGETLEEVVLQSTWNPAQQIKLENLGHLSVGAPADVAVFRVDTGKFGFVDQTSTNEVYPGTQRLACELTLRNGTSVYDLNGRTATPFDPNAPLAVPGGGGRGAAPKKQ